jgi:cholesterol oxidase
MPKVIIIGSGFGGAIAALRFRQKGWHVSVNEMGEEWPSWKMQQTQDTRYLYRLFRDYPVDYYTRTDTLRPKLVIAQGMGVGGGSLVYSGIHLRAPAEALETYPAGFRRADLDPYYARVETNLSVQTYPRTSGYDFPRRSVFAAGAAAAGLPAPQANPLAMAGCTMCGWCVPNCLFDKKRTMPLTYLARAKAWSGTGGITIWSNWKATRVAKNGAGYRVYFINTAVRRDNYHLVNSGGEVYEDADRVVIAGGAMESPALLQRSLPHLNGFSTSGQIGKNIDGQGDGVVGGIVPQTTDTYKGAIMMDHITMQVWNSAKGRNEPQYVLEDIHSIPAGIGVKFPASFPSADNNKQFGMAFKQKTRNFARRMLAIAIMGKSPSGGNITVSNDKGVAVASTAAYALPTGSVEKARAIITALGGEVAHTPYEREGMIATVHPTGGCAMGSVVSTYDLQVHNNPGLYVIDGSVLPSSTWRNPSHTIAAVAERALDNLLGAPPQP